MVHQAYDPDLDRVVALKVLRADVLLDDRMVDMFFKEARVAARLVHPHIIAIYDIGVVQHSPYITMQYVEGPSLDMLLRDRRPLPLRFALHVLLQMAEALGFAHEANVLHLDVKPGNILIGSTRHDSVSSPEPADAPHALLTDFTMARLRSAVARHGHPGAEGSHLAGTLCYASPEQLGDGWEVLGPASDIFSLGVVLHEMLTGQPLFAAEHPAATRQLVLASAIKPPSRSVSGLPGAVDELCARMLARPVSERLQLAGEVIARVKAILEAPQDVRE